MAYCDKFPSLYDLMYVEVSYYSNGYCELLLSTNTDDNVTFKLQMDYDDAFDWCMENDIIFNDFENMVCYNDF